MLEYRPRGTDVKHVDVLYFRELPSGWRLTARTGWFNETVFVLPA